MATTGWRWAWLAAACLALSLVPADRASANCTGAAPVPADTLGERIATMACQESLLWYEPFINAQGHLASMSMTEAEAGVLADGATPAWKRVAEYWRGSGLLWEMNAFPGAGTCARAGSLAYPAPDCRAFVIDQAGKIAAAFYKVSPKDTVPKVTKVLEELG